MKTLSAVLIPFLLMACGSRDVQDDVDKGLLTSELLQNATYRSSMVGVVKLTGGKYSGETPESREEVSLVETGALGDLNQDGVDDTAVLLISWGGGSGVFYELAAVINEGGEPVHLASAELGDRVRVDSTTIQDGAVVVQMVTHDTNDPLCCPTVPVVLTYRLEDHELLLESRLVRSDGS